MTPFKLPELYLSLAAAAIGTRYTVSIEMDIYREDRDLTTLQFARSRVRTLVQQDRDPPRTKPDEAFGQKWADTMQTLRSGESARSSGASAHP